LEMVCWQPWHCPYRTSWACSACISFSSWDMRVPFASCFNENLWRTSTPPSWTSRVFPFYPLGVL
jgi:hypothetical protein